jgi:Zn-dependent protease
MTDHPSTRWPAPATEPAEPDYEPIQPGSGRGSSWRERLRKAGGPIAAFLVLLATKGKAILLLLPKLKIFTTSASMLRREGVEASAPMFIPFLGAVIAAKSMGDDAAAEARVGLAGPILGSIATLVPLGIWLATDNEFWQALAYVGFFLNLLNLLPVLPLDGGRAMAALSPWVWFVGYAGLVGLTIAFPNPILILVLIFGGVESWRRWKARNTPESRAYHAIPGRTRALVAVTYLGLAAVLAVGVAETFLEKDFGDV